MKPPRWMLPAIALTACFLPGCESLDDPTKIPPGTPNVGDTRSRVLRRLQFEDLPVPAAMQLVTRNNRTFSFVGGGVRVGRFRYVGTLTPAAVSRFYSENMVLRAFGWTPVDSPDEESLQFEKPDQKCSVRVFQEHGHTIAEILVQGSS